MPAFGITAMWPMRHLKKIRWVMQGLIELISKSLLGTDYLEVKVSSIINTPGEQRVYVDFPFDRLYLEENKAPEAEQIYRDAMNDNQASAYALVYIKDGRGVLTDVVVDGKSLSGD